MSEIDSSNLVGFLRCQAPTGTQSARIWDKARSPTPTYSSAQHTKKSIRQCPFDHLHLPPQHPQRYDLEITYRWYITGFSILAGGGWAGG